MSAGHEFDPAALRDRIAVATDQLLHTCERLSDADARAPSLLPGWSRGHVLTHIARNADGGRRLLGSARTGVPAAEYPSLAVRAEEIEAGAGRGIAELIADVADSAAAFAAEYDRMPEQAWQRVVRWTAGQRYPAQRAADSRWCEVLVHHADLRAGYGPRQWPAYFVSDMLDRVVDAFTQRTDAPAMCLYATDSGVHYEVGCGGLAIRGPACWLLAWLMGRTDGTTLTTRDGAALPTPPFLY